MPVREWVWSQSPDGDFFDPESRFISPLAGEWQSQSPDGDFFDPECGMLLILKPLSSCHSPLTGIFLIRS